MDRSTNSCATTIWTRAISSIRASVPGFQRNQFGVALGGPIQKDKTFVFGNFEGLQQHLHQTGVDLVPDNNARNGYLPCKLVTPAPSPCPASGLVFVGVSPLINAWPAPTPGAPDFGGIAEAFNNPLQTIRDDFGTVRLDHDLLAEGLAERDLHHRRQRGFHAHQHQFLQHRRRKPCASRWRACEETHVFSPTLLNTARVGYSRAGYFFTGEPTPGTPAAEPAGISGGRSDRRAGGGRQRGVESHRAVEPGRQQQRKQSARRAKSVHL